MSPEAFPITTPEYDSDVEAVRLSERIADQVIHDLITENPNIILGQE